MSDSDKINQYCLTKNLEILMHISKSGQKLIIWGARAKKNCTVDSKTQIADEILDFFYPFPINYKPKIHHASNTCWIAASMWFVSSQQLLLNMLKMYAQPLPEVLELIKDKMDTVTDKNDRKYAFEKGLGIVNCLVNKKGYKVGDVEDISRNWNDIMDIIPENIKNQLYPYRTLNKSREILSKDGHILDIEQNIELYQDLVAKYNNYYQKVENEFRKHILEEGRDATILDDLLGGQINLDITVQGVPLYEKFWENSYFLWTGKKNDNITNFDRFCGNARGFNDIVYGNLCKLHIILKDIRNLQNNYTNIGEIVGKKEWGIILPTTDTTSIQNYISDLLIQPEEVKIEQFNSYNIKYVIRHEMAIMDKTYIIIQLNFPYDWDRGEIILPKNGNFVINKDINIGNQIYTLTSVGTKSGGQRGGHWWCLVRNLPSDKFIEYNDTNNERTTLRDMKYINQFSFSSGFSGLLCYTLT